MDHILNFEIEKEREKDSYNTKEFYEFLKKIFNQDGSYMYILKGENSSKAEIECRKCHKTVEIKEDTFKEAEKTLEKLGFSLSENIHLTGECEDCKKI